MQSLKSFILQYSNSRASLSKWIKPFSYIKPQWSFVYVCIVYSYLNGCCLIMPLHDAREQTDDVVKRYDVNFRCEFLWFLLVFAGCTVILSRGAAGCHVAVTDVAKFPVGLDFYCFILLFITIYFIGCNCLLSAWFVRHLICSNL